MSLFRRPSSGVSLFRRLAIIEANTHPEALRKAMLCLTPAHYDALIRLEQKPPDGAGAAASVEVK